MRYTEEDGLLNNQISTFAQDSAGFTWIGTPRGLCRFDGSRMEIFYGKSDDSTAIDHDFIIKVYLDQRQQIWICTASGLNRYLPESDNFKSYKEAGLVDKRINDILQDRQGTYWLAVANKGLARFDPDRNQLEYVTFILAENQQNSGIIRVNDSRAVIQDHSNDSLLWVGTQSGLVKYNKYTQEYTWHHIEHADKDWMYLLNSTKLMYQHDDGLLYIGSWSGAYTFEPITEKFQIIGPFGDPPEPSLLHKRSVLSIMPFPNEQIGITYSTGFVFHDPKSGRTTSYHYNDEKHPLDFQSGKIRDNQGRIWGLSDVGLYIFNPLFSQFTNYPLPTEQEDWVYNTRSVVESEDGRFIYVCGYALQGIFLFDRQLEKWELIPVSKAHYDLRNNFDGRDMIRLRNGKIVLVSATALFEFDEEKKTIRPLLPKYDFGTPSFRRMVEDHEGNLWLGSRRNGVYKVDLKNNKVRRYQKELLVPGDTGRFLWVEQLIVDKKGSVWIRTASHYSVYLPESDQFINIAPGPDDDGLSMPNVAHFSMDKQGRIWIAGAKEGLGLANMEHPEKGLARKYDQADGMAEKYVLNLGTDQKGFLWVEHEKGISRFDPETEQFIYFDRGYGIPTANQQIMHLLSTGEMVIGTTKGISIFHPDSLQVNQELPKPYLTSFKVFDKELLSGHSLQSQDGVQLSYKQNFFSFEFSAIAYNLPQKVTYAYQLEGVDEDWVQAGHRNYASYTNINGGNYVFKLRAANNEGLFSEQSYKFNVSITTPWWKAPWFWSVFIIGLLWVSVWSLRWRIRQIRNQSNMKAEFNRKLTTVEMNALRAQMNPHFIFNSLNSIDYYILKNDPEKASDYLNRFSRLIRLILQNSRAKYVNLKDELEALKLYIEMESLRFEEQFDYIVRVEKGLSMENIEVPPMILQPYVENAIWHGLVQKQGKGRLDLEITRQNGNLHCIIQDNGIGREAARKLKSKTATRHKSMGMEITSNRLDLINQLYGTSATVEIIDCKDEQGMALGTRVELDIPIGLIE
ncbi:MAG: hypothetical protein DHS20C18_51070 [Saprospiraceae bacterium]|nr:MAG: hypothetical protein DHS20C18_51070 [Saprospiraceae bacterium]